MHAILFLNVKATAIVSQYVYITCKQQVARKKKVQATIIVFLNSFLAFCSYHAHPNSIATLRQ